jgi:hypothetical protein
MSRGEESKTFLIFRRSDKQKSSDAGSAEKVERRAKARRPPGHDGTTSGAVRDGGVHKRLRKKGERGGACVLWYSERVA